MFLPVLMVMGAVLQNVTAVSVAGGVTLAAKAVGAHRKQKRSKKTRKNLAQAAESMCVEEGEIQLTTRKGRGR